MIIKKIESKTMTGCLKRAKELFGSHAKIHRTDRLPSGRYQVVASAERLLLEPVKKKISPETIANKDHYIDEFVSQDYVINNISEKISDMTLLLDEKMEEFSKTLYKTSWGVESKLHPTVPEITGVLLENGVEYNEIERLVLNLPRDLDSSLRIVRERLFAGVEFGTDIGKGVNCFMGPTGSGKSSVIIKLATRLVMESQTVCVVLGDANSPGAMPELVAVAEILNIDVYETVADVPRGIYEYIFVDNPTREFLDSKDVRKHLVVSSSIIPEVYEPYTNIQGIDSIIITKMDEVKRIGFQLRLASRLRIPISYYSNSSDISNPLVEMSMIEAKRFLTDRVNKKKATIVNVAKKQIRGEG